MKKRQDPRPLLVVRLTEGLADRNRLPLDHVLRVLTEIKGMMEEGGQRLRREQGHADADVDFGLEIVAGFQRGSVQAQIQITRSVELGAATAGVILQTVKRLKPAAASLHEPRRRTKANTRIAGDFDPRIVARLNNIAKVQEIDRTTMKLSLHVDGHRSNATFDQAALEAVASLRTPNFGVGGLMLFGKLRELRDRTDDDDDTKGVLGELVRDNGEVWRIEFKAADVSRAATLFRRQIYVAGDATYYQAMHPKIKAVDFGADEERDYEGAFDRLYGSSEELKGTTLKDLLHELRGGKE